MASNEEGGGSSMLKVKQLLKSVGRSLSGLKTLAPKQASRPKPEQQQVVVPQEIQQHLDMYLKTDSLLAAFAKDTTVLDTTTSTLVASRESMHGHLSSLSGSRSYGIAESSERLLEVLQEVDKLRMNIDLGLVEFSRSMGRIQQRHSPSILAKSADLEAARDAVEVALLKQRQGSDGDSEKAARRQQKLQARRQAYEEKLREMVIDVPQAELEIEHSFCKELLQMMRKQKACFLEAFQLFESVEGPLSELDQYCEDCLHRLKDNQKVELRDNEKRIYRVCGPRIVEMLSAPNFAIAMAIGEVASSPAKIEEGDAPVRSLLRLMDDADLSIPFLKLNISNELPRSSSQSTLFRTPSLAGYLCITSLRMTGHKYLKLSLGPLVEQICSGDADFEINEEYLSAEEILETNTENLCKAIQWFFDTVIHSISNVPQLLRTIAVHVFHISGERHREVACWVINGLFFNALLCPAIRSPHDHGLLTVEPDDRSKRTLCLIAEAFRCVGDNEKIPENSRASTEINAVLDQNRSKLGQLIDSLSQRGQDLANENSEPEEVDEVQDVLAIHALISQNLGEVRAILVSKGFRQEVLEAEGCINGEDPRELAGPDPKSAPKVAKESEIRREEGLWNAPTDEEEEDELPVPTYHGKIETSIWSQAPPEDADLMPDTAPVRPEPTHKSAFEHREKPAHASTPTKVRMEPTGDTEETEQPIRTRRRYTQAKPASTTLGPPPEDDFSAPVGPELTLLPTVMPKLNKTSQLAREDDAANGEAQPDEIQVPPQKKTNGTVTADQGPSEQSEEVSALKMPPKTVGRLYGVGAVFKRHTDGFFYVKKVVPSGPAGKAGVEVGARVLAVDGEKLYQKTSSYLYKLVLGSEGTSVALQLQSPGTSVNSAVSQIAVRRAFIDDSHLEYSSSEESQSLSIVGRPPKAALEQFDKAKLPALGVLPSRAIVSRPSPESAELEKVGIGVTFKRDSDGYFFVKKLAPGGAAEAAGGIFVDDKILEIDGQDMHRKSNQDLTKAVLGHVGTKLTLLIKEKEGEVKTVAVTRIRGSDDLVPSQAGIGDDISGAGQAARQASPSKAMPPSSPSDVKTGSNVVKFMEEEISGMAGPGFNVMVRADGDYVVKDHLSDAEPAGAGAILPGDVLVEVDGVSLTGKSIAALQALLFGPVGSNLELVISRPPGSTRKVVRMSRVPHTQLSSVPTPIESGGVGILFRSDKDSGTYSVKRVTPNGPAAKSGEIMVGDQLLEVDGISVTGISSKKVMECINGPAGTRVELTIRKAAPDGNQVVAKLERAKGSPGLDHATDAHHAGIGVTLKRDGEGFFFIKKITEGGPAQVIGNLEVGDSLREVDGTSLFRKSYAQVADLLHGEENSVVNLGVWDADNQSMRQVPIPRTTQEELEDTGSDSA